MKQSIKVSACNWAVAGKGVIINVRDSYGPYGTAFELHQLPEDQPLVDVTLNRWGMALLNSTATLNGVVLRTSDQLCPLVSLGVTAVLNNTADAPDMMTALEQLEGVELWWLTPTGPIWAHPDAKSWGKLERPSSCAFLGPVPDVVKKAVTHGCQSRRDVSLEQILEELNGLGLLTDGQPKYEVIATYQQPKP